MVDGSHLDFWRAITFWILADMVGGMYLWAERSSWWWCCCYNLQAGGQLLDVGKAMCQRGLAGTSSLRIKIAGMSGRRIHPCSQTYKHDINIHIKAHSIVIAHATCLLLNGQARLVLPFCRSASVMIHPKTTSNRACGPRIQVSRTISTRNTRNTRKTHPRHHVATFNDSMKVERW
jgi:hypothetical protein